MTLASMAATFGVSPDFLDAELVGPPVVGRGGVTVMKAQLLSLIKGSKDRASG